MITFKEYLDQVYLNLAKRPHFRYGQTLYNTLYEMAPELAVSVVGTKLDPYATDDLKITGAFLAHLINILPSPADSGPRTSNPSAEGSTPSEGAN